MEDGTFHVHRLMQVGAVFDLYKGTVNKKEHYNLLGLKCSFFTIEIYIVFIG